MKTIFNKRNILILTLVVAFSVVTAVTYSFYIDDDSVENTMKAGVTSGKVIETFDGIKKQVWAQNTGTTPLLVRANARMICTNGNIVLDATKIATATFNTKPSPDETDTTYWVDGGDGWYYYSRLLPAEGMTNLNEYYHNVVGSTTDILATIELKLDEKLSSKDEESLYDGAALDVPVNLEYYIPLMTVSGEEEIYSHEKPWNIDRASSKVKQMLRTLVKNAGEKVEE